MIELLILFSLNNKVLTMYGVSKSIKEIFSVLTTPSYGTIKPALARLENKEFVKIQKYMSDGGRPANYYSITAKGKEELKRLILDSPLENPIQFFPTARIKLSCADVLNDSEKKQLFHALKNKAENIMYDTKNLVETKDLSFYPRMVFDNLILECQNFVSLIEGFEHAGSR